MNEESKLSQLVDDYQRALDEKSDAEARYEDAKKLANDMKEALIDAMLEDETDSIGRNGRRYTIAAKSKFSKRAGDPETLYEMLRENGLGSLITETVNARTLDSTMRSIAEENGGNLPEEWNDCINQYDYTDISVRKN